MCLLSPVSLTGGGGGSRSKPAPIVIPKIPAPPPVLTREEEGAEAPKIGKEREDQKAALKRQGKSGLKIDLNVPASGGSGLNIPRL